MDKKDELLVSETNALELVRSVNLFEEVKTKIGLLLNDTSKNFVKIGYWLLKLNKVDLALYGYKTIYDFAKDVFGLGTTSVKNMVGVANKFCDFDNFYSRYDCVLKEEYKGFSYSQLVELLSVDELDLDKFNCSMPIAEMRENKVLLSVEKCVGDIVSNHLKKIETEILPLFENPSELFRDENGLCITTEGGETALLLDGDFKWRKGKLQKDMLTYRLACSIEYKCFWKTYKDCYFTLKYEYTNKGDEIFVECSIASNFTDWDKYLKKQLKMDFNLNIDSFSEIKKKVESFIKEYVDFLNSYDSKKEKLEVSKKKQLSKVNAHKDLYVELISVPNFKLGNYIKKTKDYAKFESEIDELKKIFNVNNDSIISATGSLYGELEISLYLNLIDDYYVRNSYYGGLKLYIRKNVSSKDYKGNEMVNKFEVVDYCDKDYIAFVLEYLKEKYKSQTSDLNKKE